MRVRLDRYILAEIVGPLALGFVVYTFLLLLRFLFQSAEMIIRRGLPVSIVGRLLLYTMPNIVVLTIPMSLLFGILIAVGRLSSDSELVAMRSSGISLVALYRPILLFSAVFTLLNTFLMVYALPWGNYALQQLRLDIITQTVSQQVEPRVFFEEWENKVVYVFDIDKRTHQWNGVFIAESIPTTQENQITVAESGNVRVDQRGERIVLSLNQAIQHKVNLNAPTSYEITKHKRLDLILDDQFASSQRAKISVSKSIRELTLPELRAILRDPKSVQEQRNLAQIEIHKKFSIPMACMVFGLFGLPLGFNNRRGGKASGFAISIGVILFYYILLNNGEEAAHIGSIPAWLAMWGPNILLAVVGAFLLVRRNRDRSLLFGRIDRWVRMDLWSKLLFLKRVRREKGEEREGRVTRREPAGRTLVVRFPRLRLVFPNIMDRYVARNFLFVFSLVVLSGLLLYILADLNENIDQILKNKIPLSVIVDLYKYMSMQIFYDIAPVLVLVTTLLTFSLLSRTNEITACKALGMSIYRIALPAILTALVIAIFCGFLESEVLPASNERVAQLQDQIKGKVTARTYRRADRQWLFGRGRYIYNYLHYDQRTESLQRLQVFDFDADHHLARRLVAESAHYVGGAWIFSNGWARSFHDIDVRDFEPFVEPRIVRFPETPAYFSSEIKPPQQMRYRELQRYIRELIASGQSVPELEVELQNKIAFPVVSFIMAVVALPFAFRMGRQGALYGVGLSLVLGIIFIGVFAFFTKLGEAGALPPAVAVWSPGTVFGLLSAYLFLGVRT